MMSQLAESVRRHDPDRFLTALFAPPARREALMLLYALNHELARAREVVSEPMLALIRLQWWREVIQGQRRRHDIATPLSDAIEAGVFPQADLLALVDAREAEAEPDLPTLDAWVQHLHAGAGGLAVAAGRLLGAASPEALRSLGAAYGAAGLIRSVPAMAAQGRCLLPHSVLREAGLEPEQIVTAPQDPRIALVRRALAAGGRDMLAAAAGNRPDRAAVPAALPAVLARRDFARPDQPGGPRGVADRIAVTWAALRGRI